MDSLDVSQKLAQELGVKLEAVAAAPGERQAQESGQEHAAKVSTRGRRSYVLQGCEVDDRGQELGVKLQVVAARGEEGQAPGAGNAGEHEEGRDVGRGFVPQKLV